MLELVDKYLDYKIKENPYYIVCSFHDLRIKLDLTKEENKDFLEFAKNKLENWGYEVYELGEHFTYKNETRKVNENEQLIAILRK